MLTSFLSLFVVQVKQNDDLPPPVEDGEDALILPPPKMSISIKSTDSLQLTMTRTCLEVLTNLGKVNKSLE